MIENRGDRDTDPADRVISAGTGEPRQALRLPWLAWKAYLPLSVSSSLFSLDT